MNGFEVKHSDSRNEEQTLSILIIGVKNTF